MDEDDNYAGDDTKSRLQKTLRGAFAGSPTPLKDIPKKGGESRAKKTPTVARKPKGKADK